MATALELIQHNRVLTTASINLLRRRYEIRSEPLKYHFRLERPGRSQRAAHSEKETKSR